MAERGAWVLVVLIVTVWAVTTLVLPLVVRGYTPPPSIGTVMGSMAGGAAAYLFARRGDKKNGNGKNGSSK